MKKRHLLIGIVIIGVIFLVYYIGSSLALIENDSRVVPNSKLTYYIDVIYDGKDSEVVTSSDSALAKVNSDYIYVEDKLPEGLTFNKFITADDGTVGAVKRSDGSSCSGYVVGDSDGLEYDDDTRTISFKVKSLQAGCKLTVGIETTTPELGTNKRLDFYNTASARENYFSTVSNTVHVWMGDEDVTRYTVNYQYTGTIPDNAPEPPSSKEYLDGTSVGVENNVTLAGYTFSGWSTEDATVTSGAFTMPTSNVTFTGSFAEKATHEVSYNITGIKPDGYMAPTTKEYGQGDDVVIDTLKEGDVVAGYRFLGWTTNDNTIDLSEGIFTMPNKNIVLTGSFEQVKYKITYEFQGTEIPENANTLLPEEKLYVPGTKITLENNPEAAGYKFLGWYHENNFEMPEEDITIYGEWMRQTGIFSPTITQTIVDKKDTYNNEEIVKFKITVTNNESYPLKEVLLQERVDNISFIEGDGYTLKSDKYIVIPTIPANGSVTIYAQYKAGKDINKDYINTVELTGAIADNNYLLDTSKEYKSSVDFNVSNYKLVVKVVDENNKTISDVEYGIYSDNKATQEIGKGLNFDINADAVYYLKELRVPNDYTLSNDIIPINVSDVGKVTADGYDISTSNGTSTIVIKKVKNKSSDKDNNDFSSKQNNDNKSNNNGNSGISNNNGVTPKTTDLIFKYVGLAVISLLIIVVLIFIKKKKNKDNIDK